MQDALCCPCQGKNERGKTFITGLNLAASLRFLASLENAGYFEADASRYNPLRDQVVNTPYEIGADGCMRPLDKPGLGLEVDRISWPNIRS